MANSQAHVVAIIPDGYTCTVVPSDTMVLIGDTVDFQNLTDYVSQLFFPNANLFGTSVVDIPPGGKVSLTVGNVDFGAYGYTVYCKGKEEFGDKAARPRVIVYRTIP